MAAKAATTASLNLCVRVISLPTLVNCARTMESRQISRLAPVSSDCSSRIFCSTTNPTRISFCRTKQFRQRGSMQLFTICASCRLCTNSLVHCASFATVASSQNVIEDGADVQYRHGLPVLTLTLPSRGERCEFVLRPITETVSDFCDYVRKEDGTIETLGVYSTDGARIAGSTSIERLMQADFNIRLNDRLYLVRPPKPTSLTTTEHVQQLNDVKALVAKLHASLNTDEVYLHNERELLAKLNTMRQSLEPLEKQKTLLAAQCEKRTSRLLWFGLALMGVQLGSFARMTWFEFSWDIMEPVTYFATYTAIIGGYAYFAATRVQYEYPDAKERIALNKFYKLSRKNGFDVEKYNRMKEAVFELEKDLERLRSSPNFPPSSASLPSVEQTIRIMRKAESTSQGSGESFVQAGGPTTRL